MPFVKNKTKHKNTYKKQEIKFKSFVICLDLLNDDEAAIVMKTFYFL